MKFSRERFMDALFKFLIFSACMHIFFRFIHSVRDSGISHMNYFTFIDLPLILPGIATSGFLSNFISLMVAVGLFLIMYIFFAHDHHHEQ